MQELPLSSEPEGKHGDARQLAAADDWFTAMHLLTSTRKSFSASELQRQLGHKNYMPIWAILHKLRSIMGKRDAQYQVCGTVEMGEGFFSPETPEGEKDEPRNRGRGSQKKLRFSAGRDLRGDSEENLRQACRSQVHQMLVIDDLKSETIDGNVRMYVNPSSTITSDDSTSYTNMKSLVSKHVHQVIEPKQVGKLLPWVHIAISNAKRLLLDVYHDIRPAYLQSYLNEFCYKFNRSIFGDKLFDRLVVAALAYKNEFGYNNIA